MDKPEYKLLPCIFCTIGFNCYVAGHKMVAATYHKITHSPQKHSQAELSEPKVDN